MHSNGNSEQAHMNMNGDINFAKKMWEKAVMTKALLHYLAVAILFSRVQGIPDGTVRCPTPLKMNDT